MMKLSKSLIGKPVLSLRSGGTVAIAVAPVINPNNLKIEGFFCTDTADKSERILLYQDIREIIPQGFVVNDHDALADAEDLVRIKKFIDLRYDLIGKRVVTVGHKKIGRIVDYVTEIETMYIQKLYVNQGIIKGLVDGSSIVDRSQISEITDTKVIILDPLNSGTVPNAAVA